jgi:hypothetical protein
MVVVPKEEQISLNVAQRFFELTFGSLSANNNTGQRIFNAFLAISSMGNIIVMTYTAARVKQEIAKEGILPWPKFFAQNKDMSVGRLLRWLQKRGSFAPLFRIKWFSPEQHSERTPVGALLLHFLSCIILIFATYGLHPDAAYSLLTSLSAYVINAFFGTFLGLGILILRFKGPPRTAIPDDDDCSQQTTSPPTWTELTGKSINPTLSVISALIYTIGGLYPIIASWVPPSAEYVLRAKSSLDWYVVPTISWVVISCGAFWFLGFVIVARHIDKKHHRVFIVEKKPEFEPAGGRRRRDDEQNDQGGEGLILIHETVFLSWVGRETLRPRRQHMNDDFNQGGHGGGNDQPQMSQFAGTDFEGYFNQQRQQNTGMAGTRGSMGHFSTMDSHGNTDGHEFRDRAGHGNGGNEQRFRGSVPSQYRLRE